LTSSVFEAVRWAFASSRSGIPASSFLSLSRATSVFGILNLLIGNEKHSLVRKDGHRFWSLQRYYLCNSSDERIFFILLHAGVGIALLTNVSFTSSWRVVEPFFLNATGIGPINATIAVNSFGPLNFWAWFYGLLVSPNYATFILPTKCSGANCVLLFAKINIFRHPLSNNISRPSRGNGIHRGEFNRLSGGVLSSLEYRQY
jgi:hypothetical protein